MKRIGMKMMLGLLSTCVFSAFASQGALAAGTASSTTITNNATLNYEVGGAPQTAILDSTPPSFVVDNKVDLTVAETDGTYTDVNPNTTNQVLTFTVSNTGNTTQDFALAAVAGTDPHGSEDNFDASTVKVFVEDGTTLGYDGNDTAKYIDELAAGKTITVYVVANIPAIQLSDDIAAYTLTATALEGGTSGSEGNVLVETIGADTPDTVDIVFADGAGDTDGSRDASFSRSDAYRVLSAQLTVNKTSTVIRDPFNLDANPKHIPGAYVQYVITVSNAATASASATLTTITDTLDASTSIDPDLIVAATGNAENASGKGFRVNLMGTSRASQGSDRYFTTTSSVDGVDHDNSPTGGTISANMSLVLPAEGLDYTVGELKKGESVILTFNVKIN